MKLVELTRLSGNKFSVNPDYVVSVNPADRGGTTLLIASKYIDTLTVSEDYATVTRLFTGAAMGRDELGRFAVGGSTR